MLLNYLKGIFNLPANNRYYKEHKRKLGLSLTEFLRLKLFDHWYVTNTETIFFGRPFLLNSPHWFLQSVEEIFIHEVYKFETDNPAPIIIDCGANWGLSVIYFKLKYPGAIISAYEADKEIYKMALKNLSAFNLQDTGLFHKAIWDANGTLIFSSEGSVGGTVKDFVLDTSDLNFDEAPADSWVGNYNTYFGVYKTEDNEVVSIRLKDVLKNHNKIDFLKIDIEGAEYKVILDCADELHRVDKLFIEYHSQSTKPQILNEILAVISAGGLRYYIKEAAENYPYPFIRDRPSRYDMQLNIFCFR